MAKRTYGRSAQNPFPNSSRNPARSRNWDGSEAGAMVTGATFDALERENWFPLRRIAEELMMPVEAVRVSAEMELDLDVYDPELDMVSERGREQIRSVFEF